MAIINAMFTDLIPLDIFLSGYMKSRVFCNKLTIIIDLLKDNFREETTDIPRAMYQRVFTNLRSRFEERLLLDGEHLDDDKKLSGPTFTSSDFGLYIYTIIF